jgi:hypothetical protein
MTAASVIIGISLTYRNLVATIENDMGVSGAIAEQLIAEKVGRLKAEMRVIAKKCRGLDDEQVKEVLREEAVKRRPSGNGRWHHLFPDGQKEEETFLNYYLELPDKINIENIV